MLSIPQLEKSGLEITFKEGHQKKSRGHCNSSTVRTNRLYELQVLITDDEFAGTTSKEDNFELWHQRMGHLNKADLGTLSSQEIVLGIPKLTIDSNDLCEPCIFGKQTRRLFSLELIHSDVCGPIDPIAWNGGKCTSLNEFFYYIF